MATEADEGRLARVAARFTAWAERWIPDAYVFALLATGIVVIASFFKLVSGDKSVGAATLEVVNVWGSGFWELIPFTLQMALVIITGTVVATTRPVSWLIVKLASVVTT